MDCFLNNAIVFNRIERKYYIVIFNNQGSCLYEAKNKPNDIFENSNIILAFEKNIIEVFELGQIRGNDKILNNLIKKTEINIVNNINFNNSFFNNDINNNDNEILCIEYAARFFICGHNSGLMSIWKPDPQTFLQRIQGQKLHKGAINKILYTTLSDNKNYLISCSSDKTLIVYSIDENKVMKTQNFGDEVMDVKLVKDFNKNRVFIISLKKGKIIAVNEVFNKLFEIPSRFKTSITRHVIPLKNPNENDTRGDLLAITEGKIIDVFTWVKEGTIHLKSNSKQNNDPHINPQFQFSSPMFG